MVLAFAKLKIRLKSTAVLPSHAIRYDQVIEVNAAAVKDYISSNSDAIP